ncbi:MAG TPA: hypothetical protein VLX92_07830 [Kofleriaceae bacterium]|nr:hypothetical protein [Kofleriaceae bacterium]
MSANPEVATFEFSSLPAIDSLDLNAVIGGEGWGQWAGKYIGAGLGGAGGALLGTGAGAWTGPGAIAAGGALGGVGAAAGYDYGGKVGNWLTGGR